MGSCARGIVQRWSGIVLDHGVHAERLLEAVHVELLGRFMFHGFLGFASGQYFF